MNRKFLPLRRNILIVLLVLIMAVSASITVFADADGDYDCASGKHKFSVTITKLATEEENGERTYTCELCGYTYTTVIAAGGHIWGEWIVDKEATCSEEGHKYRLCTKYPDSPHKEEAVIPATGVHSYVETVIAPTCTENGHIEHICEYCGDSYETEGEPAVGHDYVGTVTKKACCDETGVKTYTCSHCGDTYTEIIPAVGHKFGDWITDKEPTKFADGHSYRVCENDSSHIEEMTLLAYGIEPVNTMDIVFVVGSVGMVSGFGGLIYSDLRILEWRARQHKEFLKRISEEDIY